MFKNINKYTSITYRFQHISCFFVNIIRRVAIFFRLLNYCVFTYDSFGLYYLPLEFITLFEQAAKILHLILIEKNPNFINCKYVRTAAFQEWEYEKYRLIHRKIFYYLAHHRKRSNCHVKMHQLNLLGSRITTRNLQDFKEGNRFIILNPTL